MHTQLTRNVTEFLKSPGQHFVGGHWKPGGEAKPILNPSDGSTLATVTMGSAKEINEAMTAAWKAFPAGRHIRQMNAR